LINPENCFISQEKGVAFFSAEGERENGGGDWYNATATKKKMDWVKFEPMPQAHLNQTSAIKMEGDNISPVLTAYNLLRLVAP
jgi:hypothetical protein